MYHLVAAVGPVFVCNLHPTLWFALLPPRQVGDLPFAEVKPPENVLFVCKLNPVTRDEDLELIFSRFGPIVRCAYRGAPCTASAQPSHVYRARRPFLRLLRLQRTSDTRLQDRRVSVLRVYRV